MRRIYFSKILIFSIVILIFIPTLSPFFTIPAKSSEPDSGFDDQDSLMNDSSFSVKAAGSKSDQSETQTLSHRDLNNNKISDVLESWIGEDHEILDIILIYHHPINDQDIEKLERLGLEIVETYWYLDMIQLRDVPVETIQLITQLPGIERIENLGKPILYSDVATPAVFARESSEYSPFTAWELGYFGAGVNIAVVDTGADNAHPSLAGKWVAGADISKPETFFTPRDGSFDADDTNGHGTTCSGIAMGTGAPDGIYMGAAPEAKLVDVRIGTMIGYAPGEGPLSFYDASLKGIEWVIEHHEDSWAGVGEENHGIDIISLSWGIDVGGNSDGSDPYSRTLDRAVDSGVIVVHAAGNSGPENTGFDGFASASNGISVAATDDLDTIDRANDIIAEYSSRGPRTDNGDDNPYNELKPDIAAPGTHIMQVQFDPIGDGSGNGYGNRGSGTSYATPVVAGVVAMMLEANPELTPDIVKEILHLTAERRGEPTIPDLDPFWNRDFGYGIVDSYKAVKLSESVENVDFIDVNLQCFITDIERGKNNVSSGITTIQGLAFSKSGHAIKQIGISIDNSSWKAITNFEQDGIYYRWQYKIDTYNLKNGNHTISVRAGGDPPHSLIHSLQFAVHNGPRSDDGFTSTQISIYFGLFLIIAVAAFVYFYNKKKEKQIE